MSDFLQTKTILISVLSLTWWIYSNDPTASFYFPETSFRTSLRRFQFAMQTHRTTKTPENLASKKLRQQASEAWTVGSPRHLGLFKHFNRSFLGVPMMQMQNHPHKFSTPILNNNFKKKKRKRKKKKEREKKKKKKKERKKERKKTRFFPLENGSTQ